LKTVRDWTWTDDLIHPEHIFARLFLEMENGRASKTVAHGYRLAQLDGQGKDLFMKSAMTALALVGAVLVFSGCTETERRATTGGAIGAATGAAVGALATGNTQGALVGAAIGAGTGALIGAATTPGYCIYRDRYGRRYEARCR
jgi:Glycine zipper